MSLKSASAQTPQISRSQVPKFDALLEQQVEMNPQPDMPLDDYLIQLAKKADVNFIADATELPEDAKVQPYPAGAAAIQGLQGANKDKWQPTLLNRLTDVAAEDHLSQLRQGERTFLFWKEPDVRELGRLIAQERRSQPVLTATEFNATQAQLADYLQRFHGWKMGEPQPELQIRFADFPLDLRTALIQIVRAEVSGTFQHGGQWVTSRSEDGKTQMNYKENLLFSVPQETWFSDEFWKNAWIKTYSQSGKLRGTSPPQMGSVSYLIVGGTVNEHGARPLFDSIGRLDFLQPKR